ncbi:hypothetical protein [Ferrovum sp.]|uniref:hypothetical protein n=1 Tax=Ferrovum sp. TaxID=2609467 RepID=UPI00260A6D20|nr:hypothetical protein [Ferrovum sp.]
MDMNTKASEFLALVASINPSSQAVGSLTTGWVSMANVRTLLAIISTGTLGALSTVDASLSQAVDATGTGAKAVTGKAITTLTGAGGVQALINLQAHELDVANGYQFVELTLTVGVAASETAALLLGASTRYEPASTYNQAGVTQIVG